MSSRFFYLLNSMIYDLKRSLDLREGFTKKVAVLFNFVQMKGGEGPAQIFCHFFISAFLVNKRSLFLQNANNLNFKLFLGRIHDPQSKYSAFILDNEPF